MLKRGRNNSYLSQSNKNINIDLQLNLLNTWTKFNVPDYYQNIFLVHLDELTPSQAEIAIKKEIGQTLEKKSASFQLLKLQKERNKIINKLQQSLKEAEERQTQPLLNQICSQIKQLRQVNLIAAEHILKMESIYHCNSEQSAQKQLEYYDSMLSNLDRDNQFLKESVLSKHLEFDQGYDPFLMYDYERIHRSRDQSINPSIKQLFDINISYAYRLMKTKSMIVQLRAQASRVDPGIAKQIKMPSNRPTQNDSSFQKNRIQSKGNISKIESFYEDTKTPVRKSLPLKLDPLPLYPSKQSKSRTTIYKDNKKQDRPETSSITEFNQKYTPKLLKRQSEQPPSRAEISYLDIQPEKKKNKQAKLYYQYPPRNSVDLTPKAKYLKLFEEDNDSNIPLTQKDQKQLVRPYKYKATVGQIYKSIKLDPVNKKKLQTNKIKLKTQPQQNPYYNRNLYIKDIYRLSREKNQISNPFAKNFYIFGGPQVVKPIINQNENQINQSIEYTPKHRQVIHYNPIKKQEYDSYDTLPKKQRYDFTPPKRERQSPKFQNQIQSESEEQNDGLIYEDPISKYNLKRKKNNKQNKTIKSDQESQTVSPREQTKQQKQQVPKKTTKPKVLNTDSDQTLQDEDIVDERVNRPTNNPPIRSVKKKQNQTQPQKKQSKTKENINNDPKKEIKIKVGKATLEEVIQLLKKYQIKNQYLNSFDLQKTISWIKINQTYLTEFTINNQTAIIALCSPIPSIGIALKFWALVSNELDFNTICNLFIKYLDFIEKSATSQKILFSGKPFKELEKGQFTMKRQNLYERTRKSAAPDSKTQFQAFLYIECSNLKFTNKTKNKILSSQDIEQFSQGNSLAPPFLAEVNNSKIPSAIKPLIKYDQNLQNFKKVNQILSKQNFDNYQASSIQASDISLMRLYLNTSLKSTFIAQDNCFKFNGTLLHQKDRESVVSVGLNKNNGVIYFGKNVSFSFMKQATKKDATNRTFFTVPMFNKKLYGKMPEVQGTCYGNWQINLTWQDQIQGRIKHNMKQSLNFGPQNFKVLIELQKILVVGFQVNKQDLI